MKKIEISVFRRGPARPRRTGTKKIGADETPPDTAVLYVISGGRRRTRRRPDPDAVIIRPPVFVVKKTS